MHEDTADNYLAAIAKRDNDMSKAYCKGAVRYQGERGSHHDGESCGAASSRARRLTRRVAASMIVVFGLSLPVVASSAEGDDLHLVALDDIEVVPSRALDLFFRRVEIRVGLGDQVLHRRDMRFGE